MNYIERIVLRKGEKELESFRLTENILKTPEFSSYSQYLPLIKSCYEQASYWHGTGRYQYSYLGDSRYGEIDFKNKFDILASVLEDGGLKPHFEPWLKKIEILSPTISMTPFRMYAKLYAGLYLYEHDALIYEFGSTNFWFKIFIRLQAIDKKFLWFLFTKGILKLFGPSVYQGTRQYIRSIRSDLDKKPVSIFKGHLIHTDITGNYPILIGVKNSIKILSFNLGLERLETRTNEPISLKDISHLEVPLSKIKETEDLLKKNNISLTIIPLEYGEMYCSNFMLKDLTII